MDPWAKAERIGYLHEIEWKSKNTPGFYEIKRKLVEEKSKNYSFRQLKKTPAIDRTFPNVSPARYDMVDAYNSSQVPKPRFYIGQGKVDNFISQ